MRYKLIKWWAQSYLAGVPKVICGFRDHTGCVRKLQTYNTLEIPRIVRHERDMWDASICINFLNKFLTWVKSVAVKDDDKKVYMFSWRTPFIQVTVSEMEDESHAFLPEWFIKSQDYFVVQGYIEYRLLALFRMSLESDSCSVHLTREK